MPTDSLLPIEISAFVIASFRCVDRQFISLAFGQCHAAQTITTFIALFVYVCFGVQMPERFECVDLHGFNGSFALYFIVEILK